MNKSLTLASQGQSDYRIVVGQTADAPTRHAASELQHFLHRIAGVTLPLVSDIEPAGACEIVVGDSARRATLASAMATTGLGTDGYRLRAEGRRLVIAGGAPRGVLYGVYGLLRDYLGCRWFTREIDCVPAREDVVIGPLDQTFVPPLAYRNFMLADVMDADWCARNQVNGFSSEAGPKQGGKISHWQFGHSFHDLLPVERYYADHPEYFALVRGQRLRELTQPCCTNKEVVRVVTENLRDQMRRDVEREQNDPENPAPEVYHLAQNDWGNCCTCPSCAALMQREEASIAPLIQLCNQVVEELADEFPDKSVMTIAYRFSRRPPKALRAHPKLIVQLCSIECCFSHPLASCDCADSESFRRDLEGWGEVAERLWIWDYTAIFHQLFLPQPNVHLLGPNIRYFADHGVTGVFEQDSGNREFNGLRGYLLARQLWDPAADARATASEFLEAVYGAAAEPLGAYIDLVADKAERDNVHVRYKFGSCPDYLTPDVLARAAMLWDEAQAAVAGDPDKLERVQDERQHLRYASIERQRGESLVSSCTVQDGSYCFDKPEALLQEAGDLASWSKANGVRLNGFGLAGDAYEELVRTETVCLRNDDVELSIVPRLGARITGLRGLPDGRNLFDTPAPGSPDFPQLAGYGERWLSTPEDTDEAHSVVFSHDDPDGDYACIYRSHGYYAWPAQFEQIVRLPREGAAFEIETLLANRGSFAANSAMEVVFPFCLGASGQIDLWLPARQEGDRLELPTDDGSTGVCFSAADVAQGLVLAERAASTALRYTPRAEGIDEVRVTLEAGPRPRLLLMLRTSAFELVPGSSVVLRQTLEILDPQAEIPGKVRATQ